MNLEVTGNTILLGLLGSPVRHSKSPQMHNISFDEYGLDYRYLAFDIGLETLEKAVDGLRAMGAKGFNVTMPDKALVATYIDQLSREAQLCGAVNCVSNEGGVLVGYNTDGYGFVRTLSEQGVTVVGAKMTLIGTGGASSAICTQCALDGMKEIALFGIKDATFESAAKLVERLNDETDCNIHMHELGSEKELKQQIRESSILTNATPVGMGKMIGISPIKDESVFFPQLVVMDLIYNPEKTALLESAEAQGCKIINGKDMLLWQGAKSFQIWTGLDMPVEKVRTILADK